MTGVYKGSGGGTLVRKAVGTIRPPGVPPYELPSGVGSHLDASTLAGVTFTGAVGDGEILDTVIDVPSPDGLWQCFHGGSVGQKTLWIANAQNGLGAIEFANHDSSRMETAPILSTPGDLEAEIFAVVRKTSAGSNRSGLWQMGSDEDSTPTYHATGGSQVQANGWGRTNRCTNTSQNPGGVVSGGNFHVINCRTQNTPAAWELQINNIVQRSQIAIVGWLATDWVWGQSGSGEQASLDLGESVIFDRVLSAGERTDLLDHLNSKWGLGF